MDRGLWVIKVGGAEGLNREGLADELAELYRRGQPWILVHGGSKQLDRVATALGHPPRFLTSPSGYVSRRTDRRTLEIFEMVYCGAANKGWVERLQARGVPAVGLSGLDGGLWRGPRKRAIRAVVDGRTVVVRDDYTGKVTEVNGALLRLLLEAGYVPVLTPPALSTEGEAINVDGDRAAAATAAALGAPLLILLSDVPGLLRDLKDPASRIPRLAADELEAARRRWARGRMGIKLLAAREALEGGVGRVILADGRLDRPIARALAGEGTEILDPLPAPPEGVP